MTWKTFYDHYDEWSTATLKRHVADLEDYGNPAQIVEVADCLDDADSFIRAALNAGVIFSPDELLSLDGVISQSTMETAIRHSLKGHVSFIVDDILAFDGIVGKDVMTAMVKAAHLTGDQLLAFDGLVDESVLPQVNNPLPIVSYREDKPPRHGILATLFLRRNRKKPKQHDDFYVAYALHDMTMEEDRRRRPATFHVGDIVHAGSMEGVIIDKNGSTYTVRCGHERYYFKAFEMSK